MRLVAIERVSCGMMVSLATSVGEEFALWLALNSNYMPLGVCVKIGVGYEGRNV